MAPQNPLADISAFTKRARHGGARHRARLRGSAPRSPVGDADRGVQDVRCRCDCAGDRGRTARFRRKSRAGGQGEVARVNVGLPRHRAASDRAAAIQQGQGSRGAVRRDPFGRPSEHLRSVSQGNRFPETPARIVRPAQYRRGAAEGGRRPRRSRRLHCRLPGQVWPVDFRPDVHSAGQRGAGAAFRADREDRRAQRTDRISRWA